MKTILTLLTISLAIQATAQSITRHYSNDTYFPAKGKFSVGLMTTYSSKNPPPILVGEVVYAISDRVNVGVLGGSIGILALYGGKLNVAMYQKNDFRVSFKMMSIMYPERDGTFLFDKSHMTMMPWMLTSGIVDAEWRTDKNIRWSIGAGLTETHCVSGMKIWLREIMGRKPIEGAEPTDPFDLLMTVKGSVSIPLSKKFTFRPEAFANFQRGELIKRGEHKVGFPVIATVTFLYAF